MTDWNLGEYGNNVWVCFDCGETFDDDHYNDIEMHRGDLDHNGEYRPRGWDTSIRDTREQAIQAMAESFPGWTTPEEVEADALLMRTPEAQHFIRTGDVMWRRVNKECIKQATEHIDFLIQRGWTPA